MTQQRGNFTYALYSLRLRNNSFYIIPNIAMPTSEARMEKIDNGYIVSYWERPPTAPGRSEDEMGLGEHKREFYKDADEAARRIAELTSGSDAPRPKSKDIKMEADAVPGEEE